MPDQPPQRARLRVTAPRRPGRRPAVRARFAAKGASRYDWRDPYHVALSLSWPHFFLALLGLELAINLVFALLYLAVPGSIGGARPGVLTDAFFFSLETLATVGYGVMAPATLYGHLVSAVEILTGLTMTAITTGLLFVRFSRPKARILYADRMVITVHNGCPTLMARIANGRQTLLSEATVRLAVLVAESTTEGQRYRRMHDLKLLRGHNPFLALTWTLMHPIDRDSPLFGMDDADMVAEGLRFFLGVEARDEALGTRVNDLYTYEADEVLHGMRYGETVTQDETGRTVADLSRLSAVEPDPAASRAAAHSPRPGIVGHTA